MLWAADRGRLSEHGEIQIRAAAINALGNLGGFVGPYVGGWLQDLAGGSFLTTSVFLAACLLAAGLVALTLRRRGDRPVEEVEATRAPAGARAPH